MGTLLALSGLVLILLILWDGFEVMMLPRRVMRPYRYTRFYYLETWLLWRLLARCFRTAKRRATFLSLFGPLSLLGLFFTWVLGLIFGFGFLHWAMETPFQPLGQTSAGPVNLSSCLYLSGVTFFTLGYGDLVPVEGVGRFLTVMEAGLGFVFLACVIGYLPVLYQAFSRREVTISLMDARAGSPPTAGEFMMRLARARNLQAVVPLLGEWERWAGEVLESHISYPILAYYRSQHDNQSWLASLTFMLDTCSLLMAAVKEIDAFPVQLTFAMARHAAVDLALVFRVPPHGPAQDRLPCSLWLRVQNQLRQEGLELREGVNVEAHLAKLRGTYEPFLHALAKHFLLEMPPILADKRTVDNWQTSAWTNRLPEIERLGLLEEDDHVF